MNETEKITEEKLGNMNNDGFSSWLDEELKTIESNSPVFETLPSLKIEEHKVVEFEVITDKPFGKWTDSQTGIIKRIIPIMHEEQKMNFWLNVKNPLYKQIVENIKKGITYFKVVRTGQAKNTKYNLVN